MDENSVKLIMRQLLKGLHHCHTQGILHRDIKLENILIKSKTNLEIRIIDFGFGIEQSKINEKVLCGTPQYLAPEIVTLGH